MHLPKQQISSTSSRFLLLLFFIFVQSYSKFMLKKPAEKEIARIGPSKNPAPHDFPIFLQSALELIITYFNYNRLIGGSPQSNRHFQKKSQDTLSQVDKNAKCHQAAMRVRFGTCSTGQVTRRRCC